PDAPEQPFDLLTFAKGDDGLFPVSGAPDRARAYAPEAAPLFPAHGHGVDVPHLDVLGLVLLLQRLFDLGLAGRGRDLERVAALRVEEVRAFGDDRSDHDLAGRPGRHLPSPFSRWLKFSSISSIDPFASSSYVCEHRSPTFRSLARTEDHATAFHARLPGRAMPGPAGAFLAVWLGAAARNRGAGLGAGGALASVGELAHVGLVHDRHVRRLGEDRLRQIDLAVAL